MMKELFLSRTINFLKRYHHYSDDDIERLEYGLEGIYLTITKLIIIIFLAIILNIVKEIIILLALFNVIRYFGFGIHARKSIECLLSSILIFIVIPFCVIKYPFPRELLIISALIGIICILIWAPADTVKRPLKNRKKRIIRKYLTLTIAISYFLFGIFLKDHSLSSLFFISIIIQAIIVNPLTYMLFRQPFNNYK